MEMSATHYLLPKYIIKSLKTNISRFKNDVRRSLTWTQSAKERTVLSSHWSKKKIHLMTYKRLYFHSFSNWYYLARRQMTKVNFNYLLISRQKPHIWKLLLHPYPIIIYIRKTYKEICCCKCIKIILSWHFGMLEVATLPPTELILYS